MMSSPRLEASTRLGWGRLREGQGANVGSTLFVPVLYTLVIDMVRSSYQCNKKVEVSIQKVYSIYHTWSKVEVDER